MKLTNAKVKQLPIPEHGQTFYWDAEIRGFGVRVTSAGNRSFVVQSRVRGRTCRLTLGPAAVLTYDNAKKRALANLLKMYDGIDPQVEKRKEQAQSITLGAVILDYLAHKQTKNGPLRESSKEAIEGCIVRYFNEWIDRPVIEITREKCVQKFREFSGTAPVQTNIAFRNLRALLNWAKETNVTNDGQYTILPVNPVCQMFKSESWNPEKPRTGRIKKNKIGHVWNLLQDLRNIERNRKSTTTCSDLVAFMLLTGTRLQEAARLTWDRVKLFDALPTFHLDITKNYNPVTFPIGDVLRELLLERYESKSVSNYVFPAVSIVLTGGASEYGLRLIMRQVAHIYLELLSIGFLARGAITIGPVWHPNIFQNQFSNVMGGGYVSAYKLQETIARHPRIMVSDKVVQQFSPLAPVSLLKEVNLLDTSIIDEHSLLKDADGITYVHVMQKVFFGKNNILKPTDDDSEPFNKFIEQLAKRVLENLEKLQPDSSAYCHWSWMDSYIRRIQL